jgi:hypothetical protein
MKSLALTAGTLAAAALVWYAVPSFAEPARRVPAPTADLGRHRPLQRPKPPCSPAAASGACRACSSASRA